MAFGAIEGAIRSHVLVQNGVEAIHFVIEQFEISQQVAKAVCDLVLLIRQAHTKHHTRICWDRTDVCLTKWFPCISYAQDVQTRARICQ